MSDLRQSSDYALVRVRAAPLSLDEFAAHDWPAPGPDPQARRPRHRRRRSDPAGELRFPRSQVAAVARMQRLRAGFALNYAAVPLVTDLLDRIAVLETALRGSQWPGR